MAGLSLKHIYKKYPGGVIAVSDFNLEIKDKEFVVFVGPSGCGKSTFLKTLNRMNDLVDGVRIDGKILLDGEDIYDPKVDTTLLRKKIGMVFQQFNLFKNLTVLKNIMLAPVTLHKMTKSEAEAKAKELLNKVAEESGMDLNVLEQMDEKQEECFWYTFAMSLYQQDSLETLTEIPSNEKIFIDSFCCNRFFYSLRFS